MPVLEPFESFLAGGNVLVDGRLANHEHDDGNPRGQAQLTVYDSDR